MNATVKTLVGRKIEVFVSVKTGNLCNEYLAQHSRKFGDLEAANHYAARLQERVNAGEFSEVA